MEHKPYLKFGEDLTVNSLFDPEVEGEFHIEASNEEIESIIRNFKPQYLVYCGPNSLWEDFSAIDYGDYQLIAKNVIKHSSSVRVSHINGLEVPHLFISEYISSIEVSFILLKGEGAEKLASLLGINPYIPHIKRVDIEKVENAVKTLNNKFNLTFY